MTASLNGVQLIPTREFLKYLNLAAVPWLWPHDLRCVKGMCLSLSHCWLIRISLFIDLGCPLFCYQQFEIRNNSVSPASPGIPVNNRVYNFSIDTCHLQQCANCDRSSSMTSPVDRSQIYLRGIHMYSNSDS